MTTQPYWTSKTFWAMVIGFIVYIVSEQFGFIIPESVIVGIMALLGVLFRWVADQPLSVKNK